MTYDGGAIDPYDHYPKIEVSHFTSTGYLHTVRKIDSTIVPPVMASSSDASKRVAYNIARYLSSQVSSGVLNEEEKEGIESKCVYCQLLIE